MEELELDKEERRARRRYMREYRKTESGKRAVARANKKYWRKKAAEFKEDPEE